MDSKFGTVIHFKVFLVLFIFCNSLTSHTCLLFRYYLHMVDFWMVDYIFCKLTAIYVSLLKWIDSKKTKLSQWKQLISHTRA